MMRSKSSPPKFGSPPVANTSTVPPPTSSTLTSNVPPPRSNTKTVSSSSTSTPYANAAATGSFSNRTTFNPARCPARVVASICKSSKYAGTVITALSIVVPNSASAASNSVRSTCALTSSGSTKYSSPLSSTAAIAANFVSGCGTTLYGTSFACALHFLYFRPMNRFTLCSALRESFCILFFASTPTVTAPSGPRATTDGIVRRP
mmetsp:Transcript_7400/g.29751  ORF Transcript_7400/g.29751 Transcript_7400/m.29751 type:complete len:205 (-) Transcript_7400:208-822(-)